MSLLSFDKLSFGYERFEGAAQAPLVFIASSLLVGDGAQLRDNLLPALAHGFEGGVVLRRDEAGMDKAKARSVSRSRERPRDDSVQRRAVSDVFLVSAFPGIDEALLRRRLQHLAVNDAVPRAGRRRLKREALAGPGLEPSRLHQPAADQLAGRQGLPAALGRMRKHFLDHDVLRGGLQRGVVHGSISFISVLRLAKRSRQKTA